MHLLPFFAGTYLAAEELLLSERGAGFFCIQKKISLAKREFR
jgi:hypothetical protein